MLSAEEYLSLAPEARPYPAIVYGQRAHIAASLGEGALDFVRLPPDPAELLGRIAGRLGLTAARLGLPSPSKSWQEIARRFGLDERESRIFRLLFLADGPVTRESLSFAIWGDYQRGSRRLDVLISGLRAKLERTDPPADFSVKACRGEGYALVEAPRRS